MSLPFLLEIGSEEHDQDCMASRQVSFVQNLGVFALSALCRNQAEVGNGCGVAGVHPECPAEIGFRINRYMIRAGPIMRLAAFIFALLPLAAADSNLYRFSVDQDRLSGAPDFGFLNHRLEPADRLFVKGGHFYRVGQDLRANTADDERVRLFGVNLAFGANFPEEKDAARIAKRLRRLGVNLVRLHHMDSNPDRNPETAGSLLTQGPYPTLNPVSMARLGTFLSALSAEGIYANLNLHVGYTFRPEVDRVPPMPDGARIPTQSKPLHIFYPRMVDLQLEYTRKVLDGLRLKGNPVLAMVEIDNEASLVREWQAANFDRTVMGEYKAELERQWNRYLKTSGVALLTEKPASDEPRLNDFLLFLADRDRDYLRRMMLAVRESTDPLLPVAGTQMGYGGLLNLDTHADLDYQDNHFYIDHYNFPNARWDSRDWRIRDQASVGSGLAAFINMAVTREAGRPYTVSEFNQPWPNRNAAEIDPTLAAFGAFQDWDSIVHFAYSHGRKWDETGPNGFDVNGDWQKFVNIGQSAWLFRSGVIETGRKPVDIPVSKEMRLKATRQKVNGRVSDFLRTEIGFDPLLAVAHPVRLAKDSGGPAPLLKAEAPHRSDTGELAYDPEGKLLTIAAMKAAGVYGFIGTKKVMAGAIDVELPKSGRGFIALLLTSLDGRSLGLSRRMLLSNPGYTLRTQPGSDPQRAQSFINYPGTKDWFTLEPEPQFAGKPSASMGSGAAPTWWERVEAVVTLHTEGKKAAVYPLDGAGARMKPVAVERLKGAVKIRLGADSPWYEVVVD